jgi:dTDP-4-dehydrorhamnose 3,5-epimerase
MAGVAASLRNGGNAAPMEFDPLEVDGAYSVRAEPVTDKRGGFFRMFSSREFADRGLADRFVQYSISFNAKRGTVRGLHFQAAPFLEAKLVRCTRGTVFDVVVDLRPASPTYRHWCARELSAAGRTAVYVPEGCAHGFQTLVDDCELEYFITPEYVPAAARGVRWDDPVLAVEWPIRTAVTISNRDRQLPLINSVNLAP